jgi:hypothetical protein
MLLIAYGLKLINGFYLSYIPYSSLVDFFLSVHMFIPSKHRLKKNIGGATMADTNDYIENDREREEGHVDTREKNFECEDKDPNLGCDMGIDVAG